MRTLVESLRRLYKQGKVSQEHLEQMYKENKITREEYYYIIN